jgi:hypothetical protein
LRRAAALALSVGLGGWFLPATGATVTPGTSAQVAATVAASTSITKLPTDLFDQLPKEPQQNAAVVFHIPTDCNKPNECVYGDKTAKKTVVLFGDSHIRMWLPPLNEMALAGKFRLVVLGQNGCPVITATLPGTWSDCATTTEKVVSVINEMKPVTVIMADRTSWLSVVSDAQWQSDLETTFASLAPSKAKVVMIGDIQVFTTNVISCLAAEHKDVQKCSVHNPNPGEPGHESAEVAAATADSVPYINPNSWLCTPSTCSPVIGHFLAYWDSYHVSVPYSEYLELVLKTALGSALPA